MLISNKVIEIVQFLTNVLTSIGVIIAIVIIIIDGRRNSQSNQFDSFLKLMEHYESIVDARKDRFHKIAEIIRSDQNLKHEITDKQNSLSYLLIRLDQKEPFFAVEDELLDLEIKSLSFLNELCGIALSNQRAKQILLLKESNEITYYRTRLNDLLKLYEAQKDTRRFHVPRFANLNKLSVDEYFDQTLFKQDQH